MKHLPKTLKGLAFFLLIILFSACRKETITVMPTAGRQKIVPPTLGVKQQALQFLEGKLSAPDFASLNWNKAQEHNLNGVSKALTIPTKTNDSEFLLFVRSNDSTVCNWVNLQLNRASGTKQFNGTIKLKTIDGSRHQVITVLSNRVGQSPSLQRANNEEPPPVEGGALPPVVVVGGRPTLPDVTLPFLSLYWLTMQNLSLWADFMLDPNLSLGDGIGGVILHGDFPLTSTSTTSPITVSDLGSGVRQALTINKDEFPFFNVQLVFQYNINTHTFLNNSVSLIPVSGALHGTWVTHPATLASVSQTSTIFNFGATQTLTIAGIPISFYHQWHIIYHFHLNTCTWIKL